MMTGGPSIANRKPNRGEAPSEADLLLSDVLDNMLADRAHLPVEPGDIAADVPSPDPADAAMDTLAAGADRPMDDGHEDAPAADLNQGANERPAVPLDTGEEDEEDSTRSVWRFILPGLALFAVGGWIGAMLWLAAPRLGTGIDGVTLAQFIAALCVPPALLGILWLLSMRTSHAEARRFATTARAMRAEAAALERTVAVVGRQVDASRIALAEQTTSLMSIGERASARLESVGSGMAQEIAAAEQQAKTLASAAADAHNTLSILLATLPRAHGETEQLAALMQSAGLAASEQASALDAQINALSERGRAADELVSGAAQRLAAHITRMDATSETAGARLEGVTADMSSAVDDLLGRTATAIDEARKGIAAQGEAMLAMIEANQAALTRASRDSAEALAGRITAIESAIDRIAARLDEQRANGQLLVAQLDSDFSAVEHKVSAFHDSGIERTQTLAASISALAGSADAMTEALKTGEEMARKVINTSEDLLTSLDAAAREIDETLPEALARLDARITESRGVVASAKPELLALVTAAESTHDAIEAIAQVIQQQRVTLDQLSALLLDSLTSGRERATDIGAALDKTIARTQDFAEQAAPRLVEALVRVRETANTAADRARETLANVIPEAARALELASTQAMERATSHSVERHIASIASAAEHAVDAATRASERLSQQMLGIAETSALVESRIEDARTEREEAERESFGKRASLLIEALNSVAIDITKTLSNDVSDSAWAAYLKGDRGVFTRRAVRLLDSTEARDIARHYDGEAPFREQVNRYIHDFEAMLRTILAQRDGSPMAVTMLSSDMGKLYVALAQAIERLRT
ncbi:MAG: hypothetical protein ACKVOB_06215 [Sphingomonas sp.]